MKRSKSKPLAPVAGRPSGQSMTQRVAKLNRWREQYNPLRGLTLARAVQLAEAYFRGEMADYQWACFFVEQTDPDLFALLEMRLGRIVEMDYSFTAEKGADKALVEEQTQYLTEKFALIDNVYEAVEHLALAPFRGFSHCEKWYEGGEIVHLECVDQWNVAREGLRGPFRYNPAARSCTYEALGAEADMPPEQFVFMEVRRPINRIALFKFIRANLCEKDWDAFVEIYGVPGGVLIGPPNVDPNKLDEYTTAAEKIAEGGSGYAPHGSDWKPNTAARGSQPFKERLNHLSEKLVLVGTGGKLTMLTESGSGTLAGSAHAKVFDQIASAQAQKISECINRQIVEEMLAVGFPGRKQVVYYKLEANAETNTGAAVEEVSKLSLAGYQCDPVEVAERTGWKVTIKPAAPAVDPLAGFSRLTNRTRILNRDGAVAREALFKTEALRELKTAQVVAFQPLIKRVLAVVETEDDAAFDAALAQLKADLPALQKQILSRDATGELARVWENILGPALVSGAASAAARQEQETKE